MKTIANCISELVAHKPYLEEVLALKIVNYSSLAQHLNPEVEEMLGKPVKSGAILMALRRYSSPTDTKKSMRLQEVLSSMGDITVRSKLNVFTFQNSHTLIKNHVAVLNSVGQKPHVFYTFSRGIHESTLIISSSEKENIETYFKNEITLSYKENLSAISIRLPKGNSTVSGLYYQIFKRLAWEGIALSELISTTNEFIVLVEDHLVDRAFSLLKKLHN